MDAQRFFFDRLYPFQDKLLQIIGAAKTDFYLTGGTAISRGYFQHRLSDDLDMFVNDDDRFPLFSDRLLHALEQSPGIATAVLRKEERFTRATATLDDLTMKIELVNDVPSHIGAIVVHPVLGRLDSIDNILANKITAAIDRNEPKDLADIWVICTRTELSLGRAIEDAGSKATGILAPDLARVLCSTTEEDWKSVNWVHAPNVEQFLADMRKLGESLIL